MKACAGRRLSSLHHYPRRRVEFHFLDTLPSEKYLRCPVLVGASGGVEKEKSPAHEGNYISVVQHVALHCNDWATLARVGCMCRDASEGAPVLSSIPETSLFY